MLIAVTAAVLSVAGPALPLDADASLDDALRMAVDEVRAMRLDAPRLVAADKPAAPAEKSSSEHHEHGSSAPQFAEAGSASTPQGKTFGIGLQLGYPTALTIKYMLRPDQGIVAGVGGFSGFNYGVGALSLHVDYLWHPNLLTQGDAYAVTWYIGGGGEIVLLPFPLSRTTFPAFSYGYYSYSNFWIAGRVPFGISMAMKDLPFELYLEVAPEIMVFPQLTFGIGAVIGGRAYF